MYFAKNFLFLASITSFTVDTLNCHTLYRFHCLSATDYFKGHY